MIDNLAKSLEILSGDVDEGDDAFEISKEVYQYTAKATDTSNINSDEWTGWALDLDGDDSVSWYDACLILKLYACWILYHNDEDITYTDLNGYEQKIFPNIIKVTEGETFKSYQDFINWSKKSTWGLTLNYVEEGEYKDRALMIKWNFDTKTTTKDGTLLGTWFYQKIFSNYAYPLDI
jgi:hypothetical protein